MNRNELIEHNISYADRIVSIRRKYLRPGTFIDIEDVQQAARLGLVRAVDRFRKDKGAKFSTYAFQVIQTHAIREARRSWGKSFTQVGTKEGRDVLDGLVDSREYAEPKTSDMQVLRHCTQGMDTRERLIFILLFFLDWTRPQIAEHFGISKQRVYQLEQRAIIRRNGSLPKASLRLANRDAETTLLGTAPDLAIAKRLGMSESYISEQRRRKGIPAFKKRREMGIEFKLNEAGVFNAVLIDEAGHPCEFKHIPAVDIWPTVLIVSPRAGNASLTQKNCADLWPILKRFAETGRLGS